VWMVRVAPTKLIIEDDTSTGPGNRFQRFKVVVRGSRTTVENQQRQLAWLLTISDNAIPCVVPMKGKKAFGCRESLHCSPSFCATVIDCKNYCFCKHWFVYWCVHTCSHKAWVFFESTTSS